MWNGRYEARVPVGTYELVATACPEYAPFRQDRSTFDATSSAP